MQALYVTHFGGFYILWGDPPGLEKIKIVQNPRDFPDELSKFTQLFISPLCAFT